MSDTNDIGAEFRSQFPVFRSRCILQNFLIQALSSVFSDRWGGVRDALGELVMLGQKSIMVG